MSIHPGFVRLTELELMAFVFRGRPRDYGGIHLGIPRRAVPHLEALIAELDREPAGHSRKVPTTLVDEQLPHRISPQRPFGALRALRIGTSRHGTGIQAGERTGTVMLSPQGLVGFQSGLEVAEAGSGDVLLAGDSDAWSDRLWFWAADPP